MRLIIRVFIALLVLAAGADSLPALASPAEINLEVKEFRLKNGMQFLLVERPAAPQVACRLAIRAGSALEDAGKTGIAHLLEHMMFKGTGNFGTLDPGRDRELQEKIESAYQVILQEEEKREPDAALIREKRAEMADLRLEVQKIYVPQAFSSQLGRNGAAGVNAFTSKDQTQYVASMPSDMIEQWFSIVSEQIFEPSWREFYVEKEVVQREWAFRYINSPEGAAWLDLNTEAYTAHPYRNPTIGWKSDMEKYSTRDAVDFHEKYYHPANAVCVLVGNLSLEKAKQLAETYFERYPAGKRAPERVTEEPPQQGPRRSTRFLKGARTPLVRIGFHGAPMGTRDFYALDALTMVLSHGRSSRFNQRIVDRGLAVEAWAYNPDNRYGGMVILGGSPNEPEEVRIADLGEESRRKAYLKACEALEEVLLAEIAGLETDPVTSRELDRIRKLNYRDFLDRLRTNEQLADALASLEVQVGWRYLLTYLEEVSRVTPEDVLRAAKKYIRPENRTSVYIIPGGKPDEPPGRYTEERSLSGAAAAERVIATRDFTNRSAYPTAPGWKHPLSFERHPVKIEYPRAEISTAAGATVFYLPDRSLPLVDLTLLVKAGAVDEDEAGLGLSQILEDVLIRGGTKDYSPQDFALVLDENAIRISVSAGEEETSVRLSVLKEDWDRGLDLLRQIITRPRFDPGVLRVVKDQAVTALKRQGGDAQAVAGREGMIWHFKGHPYGRDPLIGIETIPGISAEGLRKFLSTYFVPSNMVISVAGDMERDRVLDGLGRLFEGMSRAPAPVRDLPEPRENPPVLALVHKPGQVQSQIHLGLAGLRRTDPDYWKVSLLMQLFGGSDSLLYTRLRDDLGLVYAAWFYQTFKWKAGILAGYIGCKGDKTAEALRETARIMTGLRKEIPEKALEQKRLDVLNSFVFNVDTPAALVEAYGRYCLRGEHLDTLERIQDAYLSAGRGELALLAKRLLDPGKLQIFVVADKSTPVKGREARAVTLGEDLKDLAEQMGIPYLEIPLR